MVLRLYPNEDPNGFELCPCTLGYQIFYQPFSFDLSPCDLYSRMIKIRATELLSLMHAWWLSLTAMAPPLFYLQKYHLWTHFFGDFLCLLINQKSVQIQQKWVWFNKSGCGTPKNFLHTYACNSFCLSFLGPASPLQNCFLQFCNGSCNGCTQPSLVATPKPAE